LFIDRVLSQDCEVMLDRCRLVGDHPLVACEQLVQSVLGTQSSLGVTFLWGSKPDSSLRGSPDNQPRRDLVKNVSAADTCANMRRIRHRTCPPHIAEIILFRWERILIADSRHYIAFCCL
jgi:hypothetical protein